MPARDVRHELIEIKISNWLSRVRRFLGLSHRFLKLFLQQVGRISLCFHRLLKDRLAATVLLAHCFCSSFHVAEGFRLHRCRVGDDCLRLRVDLEQSTAARTRYFKVKGTLLRHFSESYRKKQPHALEQRDQLRPFIESSPPQFAVRNCRFPLRKGCS